MIVKSANARLCRKCLEDSLSVEMMSRCAKQVDPDYNINARVGVKAGMPISKQKASLCIVDDMIQKGNFIDFVETIVKIDENGFMGRRYTFRGLDSLIKSIVSEGYIFDEVSGHFFENQEERISCNWGRLNEGDERKMAILRLDIVDNSTLVKNNPQSKIDQAYSDVRNIIETAVTSRIGRIWSWEGDGALAAFLIGSIEKMVVFAGIEIINELFFYNKLHNQLDSPVKLRLGACIGQVWYSDTEMERLKNETIKEAQFLESLAANDTFCVSYSLYVTMEQHIINFFGDQINNHGHKYRLYSVGLEK